MWFDSAFSLAFWHLNRFARSSFPLCGSFSRPCLVSYFSPSLLCISLCFCFGVLEQSSAPGMGFARCREHPGPRVFGDTTDTGIAWCKGSIFMIINLISASWKEKNAPENSPAQCFPPTHSGDKDQDLGCQGFSLPQGRPSQWESSGSCCSSLFPQTHGASGAMADDPRVPSAAVSGAPRGGGRAAPSPMAAPWGHLVPLCPLPWLARTGLAIGAAGQGCDPSLLWPHSVSQCPPEPAHRSLLISVLFPTPQVAALTRGGGQLFAGGNII